LKSIIYKYNGKDSKLFSKILLFINVFYFDLSWNIFLFNRHLLFFFCNIFVNFNLNFFYWGVFLNTESELKKLLQRANKVRWVFNQET